MVVVAVVGVVIAVVVAVVMVVAVVAVVMMVGWDIVEPKSVPKLEGLSLLGWDGG